MHTKGRILNFRIVFENPAFNILKIARKCKDLYSKNKQDFFLGKNMIFTTKQKRNWF